MKKRILAVILMGALLVKPVVTTATDRGTYISDDIQSYCIEIGEMYGVCPELLMAIVETESSGNRYAKNGSCLGLMQVSENWHVDRMKKLGVTSLYDEYGNILVRTDYLMELACEYGDIAYVLDKYNGNSKADYNYENGIMSEYATKVLERSAELERLKEVQNEHSERNR